MEGWTDGFVRALEDMVSDVEKFLVEVADEIGVMVDAFADATDEFAEQLQQVSLGVEESLNAFFDPILEAYLGFEVTLENTIQPIAHTVDPLLNNHAACVGCRNYHGQAYGGNLLVCGMHPYGWEDEKCPDWESSWQER